MPNVSIRRTKYGHLSEKEFEAVNSYVQTVGRRMVVGRHEFLPVMKKHTKDELKMVFEKSSGYPEKTSLHSAVTAEMIRYLSLHDSLKSVDGKMFFRPISTVQDFEEGAYEKIAVKVRDGGRKIRIIDGRVVIKEVIRKRHRYHHKYLIGMSGSKRISVGHGTKIISFE
ncbi:MAG: hypothetical protein AAB906_04345 [Patescibacteria group bacterium]